MISLIGKPKLIYPCSNNLFVVLKLGTYFSKKIKGRTEGQTGMATSTNTDKFFIC